MIIISEAGINTSNISAVNRGTNKVTTAGSPTVSTNDPVTIRNSTGNNGSYTVKSNIATVTELFTKFGYTVTGVNLTLNAFIIAGDVTADLIQAGQAINIQGSAGNDAVYNVLSVIQDTAGYAIKAINKTLNTFVIGGNQTAYFPANATLAVRGSNANDGAYTVSSSSYDGTNTIIVIKTTIPSAYPNGTIFANDPKARPSCVVTVRQTIPSGTAGGTMYYAIQDPTADGQLVWYTDDSTDYRLHFTHKSDMQAIKKSITNVEVRGDKIVLSNSNTGREIIAFKLSELAFPVAADIDAAVVAIRAIVD